MHIVYFRGVCVRTTLSIRGVRQNESGIVNLVNAERSSTHWVAYAKNLLLFISIVLAIFKRTAEKIGVISRHNTYRVQSPYQRYDQSNCGQLYLQFLWTIDA